MAKKKNRKKKPPGLQARLKGLTVDQLMAEADQLLSAEKLRDGIDACKMALKAAKTAEQQKALHSRLFQAYLKRAQVFREKNMLLEADNLLVQAKAHVSSPAGLDQDVLMLFMETAGETEAFAVYAARFTEKGPDLGLEQILADQLLVVARARLRNAAERAKISLSDAPYAMVEEDHITRKKIKSIELISKLQN